MPPPESIIQQWVRLAEHDLRQAEQTLAETIDPAYEIACFHAQQAAEKYLKVLLAANNLSVPNTHDLVLIARQFPRLEAISAVTLDELAHLTPYAVASRYPGVDVPETREDAEFALGIARKVREAVRKLLRI